MSRFIQNDPNEKEVCESTYTGTSTDMYDIRYTSDEHMTYGIQLDNEEE